MSQDVEQNTDVEENRVVDILLSYNNKMETMLCVEQFEQFEQFVT